MNKELLEKLKYEVSAGEYSTIKTKDLETILNYIEILETATNNRYPYVIGGRTLYSRLQQVSKEYLIKDYLRLRNETEQLIKDIENSISKEVIGKYLQDIQGKYIKNIAKVEKEELLNISMPVFRGIQLEGQRKILKELLEEK